MQKARLLQRFAWVLFIVLIAAGAYAQPQPKEYTPEVGQEGKDVIWVPTAQALADKMLSIAQVTAKDYVIDLGSGDGRLVITAAKRGARAHGIEYNPDLVELSKRNAAREGVSERATFVVADLFESDFTKASVLTMFLLPEINMRLRPQILNLKPGTRVVSNSFHMGDWAPDQTYAVSSKEGCDGSYCEAHLWIVPAKVEGTWKLPQGELILAQAFQTVSGTLSAGAGKTAITNGRIDGEKIRFNVGNLLYSGVVNGNTISGTATGDGNTKSWQATR